MNIEGLGEKVVDALVSQGFVTNVSDLYELDMSTLPSVRLGMVTAGQTYRNRKDTGGKNFGGDWTKQAK